MVGLRGRCVSLDEQDELKKKYAELGKELSDMSTLDKELSKDSVLDSLFNKQRITGESTGYENLDKIVGGLKRSTLVVLVGTTGTGKSLLALNMLVNMAKRGLRVCYIDLENGLAETLERILRIWEGLPASYFRDENNKNELKAMSVALENFVYYSHVSFDGGITPEKVLETAAVEAAAGTYIIVVDPLQAVIRSSSPSEKLVEEGNFTRAFKEMCQRTNTCGILCHHLRKGIGAGGEYVTDLNAVSETRYRIPTLDDVKGSSAIADFAQEVWGFVRMYAADSAEKRGRSIVKVLKHRRGNGSIASLLLDERTLRFITDDGLTANQLFTGTV
jgi:replicative DNA helicase